jgi:hypothetical protein
VKGGGAALAGSSDRASRKNFYFKARVIDQTIQKVGRPYLPLREVKLERERKRESFACLFSYEVKLAACNTDVRD